MRDASTNLTKRLWLPIAGFLVLMACGSAPRSAAPVKLTVFGFTVQAGDYLRQDALEEFTRKTGIEVDLFPTPGTSEQQMALAGGFLRREAKTPDVYLLDIVWPGTLAEHLLDLTPFLNEEGRGHIPALLANNTVGDRLVGLPFYMNAGVLYYRTDLLRKYGYTAPPQTWKELERMASRIQNGERREGKRDFWGYIWQGAAYEGLTCNALEWQASFGGGNIIESDGKVTVNNAHSIRALNTAAGWVGSISPQSVLAYTESDTLNVFRSGHAAFMRHWSSAFRNVIDTRKVNDAGMALLPAGPSRRAQSVGGFQLAVSRYSAHSRHAVELVLYLTGMEVQRRRAVRRGFMPTYRDLYRKPDLVLALPQSKVLDEAGANGWILRPSTVTGRKYGEASKAYYRSVHGVLSGAIQADAALPALERALLRLTAAHVRPPRQD